MYCQECKDSYTGYCLLHTPLDVEFEKHRTNKAVKQMFLILERLATHEGTYWKKNPNPHDVLGCAFCGGTFKKHDEPCILRETLDFIKDFKGRFNV
jgi:hypothetical protein